MTEETSTTLSLGDTLTETSVLPEGVSGGYLVQLDPDGSRRILDYLGFSGSAEARTDVLARYGPTVYWGPQGGPPVPAGLNSAIAQAKGYHFLPYPPADGIAILPTPEPVNQAAYLEGYPYRPGGRGTTVTQKPGWRRHTCTFAHEIDTQYADHSHQHRQEESYRTLPDMPHNDESNIRNQNGLQYGRGACGYVYDKLDLWSKLRPEDGGSGSIATDWRMQMPGVLEDVEALCLVCPHPYWLRQFIIRHDHIRWRQALDELLVRTAGGRDFRYMRCPKIDKSGEKWLPAAGNVATFAGNAPLNWWKRQMVNWGRAVDYYDDHYASRPV